MNQHQVDSIRIVDYDYTPLNGSFEKDVYRSISGHGILSINLDPNIHDTLLWIKVFGGASCVAFYRYRGRITSKLHSFYLEPSWISDAVELSRLLLVNVFKPGSVFLLAAKAEMIARTRRVLSGSVLIGVNTSGRWMVCDPRVSDYAYRLGCEPVRCGRMSTRLRDVFVEDKNTQGQFENPNIIAFNGLHLPTGACDPILFLSR